MPKIFTSKTQKIGELGESLACRFLMKHGYSIIERNYTKMIGEIDIIAEKKGVLHFIEVKSTKDVSGETKGKTNPRKIEVWENVTDSKKKKFNQTILLYLKDKNVSHETQIEIDVMLVYVNISKMSAKIELIKNAF